MRAPRLRPRLQGLWRFDKLDSNFAVGSPPHLAPSPQAVVEDDQELLGRRSRIIDAQPCARFGDVDHLAFQRCADTRRHENRMRDGASRAPPLVGMIHCRHRNGLAGVGNKLESTSTASIVANHMPSASAWMNGGSRLENDDPAQIDARIEIRITLINIVELISLCDQFAQFQRAVSV